MADRASTVLTKSCPVSDRTTVAAVTKRFFAEVQSCEHEPAYAYETATASPLDWVKSYEAWRRELNAEHSQKPEGS